MERCTQRGVDINPALAWTLADLAGSDHFDFDQVQTALDLHDQPDAASTGQGLPKTPSREDDTMDTTPPELKAWAISTASIEGTHPEMTSLIAQYGPSK